HLTRTLTIFGTPGYIAPEQVNGSAGKLGPTSDVYSLGAILFDLLTGRPPFLGEHALKVIQQASEKPAPKLRTLVPGLDRDLETICAKCLEREPGARYRSAGALAEDLESWLEGRHIVARPVSPAARAWRWTRRNPVVAGMATLLLVLGSTIGVMIGNDVFTLQSEIAQKIADQLGAEVSSSEKAAIQEPPTTDLVAYDSYLRGKDLISGISWSTRAKEDLMQAVQLLDQAVARDPLFFLAYGELAGAHDRIYFLGFDHTDARLKLSETAIQSLRRLRPESGETHLALAQHFYWAYADYDRVRNELVAARRTLPNESRIPLLSGYIDRRQGHMETAVEEMKQS